MRTPVRLGRGLGRICDGLIGDMSGSVGPKSHAHSGSSCPAPVGPSFRWCAHCRPAGVIVQPKLAKLRRTTIVRAITLGDLDEHMVGRLFPKHERIVTNEVTLLAPLNI